MYKATWTWTDELVVHLIELVKNAPYIWDRSCPHYKFKYMKDKFWKTAAEQMNSRFSLQMEMDAADCLKKWQNLKSYYSAEVKKKENTSPNCNQAGGWKHMSALDFLEADSAKPSNLYNVNKRKITLNKKDVIEDSKASEEGTDESAGTSTDGDFKGWSANFDELPATSRATSMSTPQPQESKRSRAVIPKEDDLLNSVLGNAVELTTSLSNRLNSSKTDVTSDDAIGILVGQDLRKLDDDLRTDATLEIVGTLMEYRKEQMKRKQLNKS